jgi:preprotein translocase subunit SecE
MSRLQERLAVTRAFFDDVVGEMKKTTWPERQELLESTVVVIVSVVMISGFTAVCDRLLVFLLKVLIRPG